MCLFTCSFFQVGRGECAASDTLQYFLFQHRADPLRPSASELAGCTWCAYLNRFTHLTMASFDLCEHVLQSSVFPTVDVSTMAFVSLGLRPDILIQAVKKEFRGVNVVFLYRGLGEDAKRCDIVINLMCELLGRVATGTDPLTVARLFTGVGDQPSKKIRALVLKSETSVLPTTFKRLVFLPPALSTSGQHHHSQQQFQ